MSHEGEDVVSDATGNSAIIEWVGQNNATDTDGTNRKLNEVYKDPGHDYLVASNCISAKKYYVTTINLYGKNRIDAVDKQLAPTNGKLNNTDEALSILQGVVRRYHREFGGHELEVTLYSCVYGLTNLTLTLVDNEKFNNSAHKFTFTFD